MLQAYSVGVDVSADGIIPFNNVIVDKGCAEELTGVGTIELEKAGMYLVLVDGTASASDFAYVLNLHSSAEQQL